MTEPNDYIEAAHQIIIALGLPRAQQNERSSLGAGKDSCQILIQAFDLDDDPVSDEAPLRSPIQLCTKPL